MVGSIALSTDVDIESTDDSGGGYNVGWLGAGEWLEYTIEVPAAGGDYILTARVATQNSGGAFVVEFDGVNETGTVSVPNTFGWQNWSEVSTAVTSRPGRPDHAISPSRQRRI